MAPNENNKKETTKLQAYSDFLFDEKNREAIQRGDKETIAKAMKLARAASEEKGLDFDEMANKFLCNIEEGVDMTDTDKMFDSESADVEKALLECVFRNPRVSKEVKELFKEMIEYKRNNAAAILSGNVEVRTELARLTVKCAEAVGGDPLTHCPSALKYWSDNCKPVKTVKMPKEVLDVYEELEKKSAKKRKLIEKHNALMDEIEEIKEEMAELSKQIDEEETNLEPYNEKLWAAVNIHMGFSKSVHGHMRISRVTKELEILEDAS